MCKILCMGLTPTKSKMVDHTKHSNSNIHPLELGDVKGAGEGQSWEASGSSFESRLSAPAPRSFRHLLPEFFLDGTMVP